MRATVQTFAVPETSNSAVLLGQPLHEVTADEDGSPRQPISEDAAEKEQDDDWDLPREEDDAEVRGAAKFEHGEGERDDRHTRAEGRDRGRGKVAGEVSSRSTSSAGASLTKPTLARVRPFAPRAPSRCVADHPRIPAVQQATKAATARVEYGPSLE